MAKKYIELRTEDGKKKRYNAPTFIKGSVAREGLALGKKLEKQEEDFDPDIMLELYQFIADKLYEGKFSAEEFEDGIDAREILGVAMEQLTQSLGDPQESLK
ncbi:phage tail assembly chaperone G [Staphylococcus auricularis]|uniref:phage tail assembly chaperone G n=1 Tax=Staphylococcus auricularis TaxID=29379 RepID=UPI001F44A9CD|nr:hypothetical protein [Staphylococcus auricularis]MCE5038396.1 hypothetical protein [Staphylococcus auricularis]